MGRTNLERDQLQHGDSTLCLSRAGRDHCDDERESVSVRK